MGQNSLLRHASCSSNPICHTYSQTTLNPCAPKLSGEYQSRTRTRSKTSETSHILLMHFLFTAPRYHPNQHFATKALLDAGHQVSFLALRREPIEVYDALKPTILSESMAIRRIHGDGWASTFPSPSGFWSLVHKLNPDVVIVRSPHTAYGLLSTVVSKLMGHTVIFYTPTLMHRQLNWRQRFTRSFPTWVARAKWITPLLGSPDQYPPAFGALRYVPFVMEPQTSPEMKKWFRDDIINVLCVGSFQPRKNHHLFLQTISSLLKRHQIHATIIGGCTTVEERRELTRVKEFHKSLELGDRVCFKSNLDFWDVQREYANHDLFVLPSRNEPAGISLLEAMAHSLPVICSDSCGLKCRVRPGENGYIFRTDDSDHLEECIERIIQDRTKQVEMGMRSYEIIASEHSPTSYVETLLAVATGNY